MVVTKSLLLVTAALLAGMALAPSLVGVTPPRRSSRWLLLALTVALIGLTALEVTTNLRRLLGFVEWDMFLTYLQTTRHGHAALLRIGTALLLGALLLVGSMERLQLPKALLVLALLFSFSYSSHAAAMGGTGPMVVDWLHFVAVSAWLGALLAVALAAIWTPGQREARSEAVGRLSAIGLGAVVVMAVTGSVSTLVHLSDPPMFVGSPYARSWLVKILLVLTVLACAAWNRLRLVPLTRRERGFTRLRTGIGVELALLAAVFVATGWLSTSPLPHSADAGVNAYENLLGFVEYLKER